MKKSKYTLEEQFEMFGYKTDNPCCICGGKPARTEPRFLYDICIKHLHLAPVDVSRLRMDENDD